VLFQRGRPAASAREVILFYLGRHEEAHAIRESFGDVGSDEYERADAILLNLLEAAVLGKDVDTTRALARRMAPFAHLLSVSTGWALGASIARLLGDAVALGKRHGRQTITSRPLRFARRSGFGRRKRSFVCIRPS
jgi:hypothetical protein